MKSYHLLEDFNQLVNGCAKNDQKTNKQTKKTSPKNQLNSVMKIWHPGLMGSVHRRNNFRCHIEDTEEFLLLDPPYKEWWVEGLTQKRSPDLFWRVGAVSLRETEPSVVNDAIKEAQSKPADKKRIMYFHPLKKELWIPYEIFSVTACSLFLLVVFLTQADFSDLSLEKYIQPVLSC